MSEIEITEIEANEREAYLSEIDELEREIALDEEVYGWEPVIKAGY